ncbi:MAG: response regulator [Bacteroidota bacterium]
MPDRSSPSPWTILVVDDDDDMRLYVRRCLHRLGAVRVVEAGDGREALRIAQTLIPDLVLADWAMPRLDGIALCRALRADPATSRIPLLLMTGLRGPPACADGVLEKPFNASVLCDHAQRLLPSSPPALS